MHRPARRALFAIGGVIALAATVTVAVALNAGGTDGAQPRNVRTGNERVSATEFPTAATTGVPAGTSLTRVPQDVTSGPGWRWTTIGGEGVVDASTGAVLSGLDIAGPVYNNGAQNAASAGRITVTDTRIRCEHENNWCLTLGPGSDVSNSEIGGGTNGHTFMAAIGVLAGNYRRSQPVTSIIGVNVHHVVQGLRIDGDTELRDSYVHDVVMGDECAQECGKAHSEGVFITAGSDITIEHNTFSHGNTACVFVQWESGNIPIGSLSIDRNQFIGVTHNAQQSSFGADIEDKGITGPISLTGNVFTPLSTWQVGAAQAPSGAASSGNTYTSGSPVDPSAG